MKKDASNYNPKATIPSNFSCVFIYGCMDKTALNYNEKATKSNHICNFKPTSLVATLKPKKCVFPFIFKGVSYKGCKESDAGYSWCAYFDKYRAGNENVTWQKCVAKKTTAAK